jgi:hypothetical protein
MSKKDQAIKVLPEFLKVIESDLMKVEHYFKQAIKVALVAEDKTKAEELAEFYVDVEALSKQFQSSIRKLVD